MKIQAFIASLLPSFSKDNVIEDVRITRTEIKDFTIPAYAIAEPLLKDWKFKSARLEPLFAQFDRMVKVAGRDNAVVAIHKGFKLILENLDEVEDLIGRTYNEEAAAAGFTYLKASLLQFVEAVAFVSKFARKFLVYVYVCETAEFEEGGTKIADSLSKGEIEWLEQNFSHFCTAFNIVTGNPSQIKTKLKDIPDVIITGDNADTLSATLGDTKVDPFQMKLIPIWMNPVYHIGLAVAEWQNGRYQAAKEELRLVQLRKLNLEKMKDGKPDAHLQQQIAYLESRVQDLNYKIHQMEKDNA